MKKLLPLLLLLIGTGAGVGAGVFLRPAPQPPSDTGEEQVEVVASSEADEETSEEDQGVEYFKMSNQFVIPVVNETRVSSLVVMSLSVEVPTGSLDAVRTHEPKLRDSFLRIMFDHANIGGFDGSFATTENLDAIRTALTEVAQKQLGKDTVNDILILEIARQDY